MSEERSFAVVFCLGFVALGLAPVLFGGGPRLWLLGIAAVVALVGLAWPAALRPLRRAWLALGWILGRVTSPIVLRLLYYGVVWPFALLRRRPPPTQAGASHWVPADPPSALDRPF